ncbi:MAG: hypothetical protein QM756_28210 [Polyangiaceae bacterium]
MTLRAARFKHSALLAGGFFATAFALTAVGGCSFFYDLNTTQCEVTDDCLAFGPQFANTQCINRVCVKKDASTGGATSSGGKLSSGGADESGGTTAQGGTVTTNGGTNGGTSAGGSGGDGPQPECTTNAECIDAHVDEAYMCIEGKCVSVVNTDCPVLLPSKKTLDLLRKPSPLLLGGFASMTNAADPRDTLAVINWDLAFNELNDQTLGGLPGGSGEQRPVLALICQGNTSDVTPAMAHLTGDLKVPGVLTTLSVDNLNSAFQYTRTSTYAASGGSPVFFLSTGSADSRLANTNDDGLMWHMLGEPRVLAATTASLIKRIEPIVKAKRMEFASNGGLEDPNTPMRVTLVYSDNLTMYDIAQVMLVDDPTHPNTLLKFNGAAAIDSVNADNFRLVDIQSASVHAPAAPDVSKAITDLQTKPPHVVIAMATYEFPQTVVPAIENYWGTGATAGLMRPIYVMSHLIYNTTQLQTVSAQFASMTPPLNTRVLGVNYAQAQDDHSKQLYSSYLGRLTASYQGKLALGGTENYYDGAYSMLYALAAAAATRTSPSAANIRDGLSERVFGISGTSVDIGPTYIAASVGKFSSDFNYRMSLYGTMGPPNFNRLSGTRLSATSAWCIQKVSNVWAYQADGLLYDATAGTFSAPTAGAPTCLQSY